MIKVAFCRLDARDDPYTGYVVAAFTVDGNCIRGNMPSQELGRLAVLLEREYLTRVAALQEELKKKYEALAAALTTSTPPDPDPYSDGLNEFDYKLVKAAAKITFPGNVAEYYT